MKHVRVQTLQPLTWGGQSYAAGATLMVPVIEALRLKRQRLITTTKPAPVLAAEPATTVRSEAIRDAPIARDESPAEPPAVDPATPAGSESIVDAPIAGDDSSADGSPLTDPATPEAHDDAPRRRKYKRRDLEAES